MCHLPPQQGGFVKPQLLEHFRQCALCYALSVGGERQYLSDCTGGTVLVQFVLYSDDQESFDAQDYMRS